MLITGWFLVLATAAWIAGPATLGAASKKKDRDAKAIIAGTVFQSSGRLLPGAKVEAVAQSDAKAKSQTVTDVQGDFAIRVPAGPATYIVTATARGFQAQQKTVEVYEDGKVRTNLILSPDAPESKK